MKLALPILLATLLSLASAQANGVWRFKMRATSYRRVEPFLSGYADYDSAGRVGFNRISADYQGFVSRITNAVPNDDLPVGELFRDDNGAQAYLLPSETANLYDFYFGTKPDDTTVLSADFAITVLNCGGNCGGLQLVYNGTGAQWMAFPDATITTGYSIRYWNGQGTQPAGGQGVWLWRDAV